VAILRQIGKMKEYLHCPAEQGKTKYRDCCQRRGNLPLGVHVSLPPSLGKFSEPMQFLPDVGSAMLLYNPAKLPAQQSNVAT
jgi:hypothetical protein